MFDKRLIFARDGIADIALKGQIDANDFRAPSAFSVRVAVANIMNGTCDSITSQALFGEQVHVFFERDGYCFVQAQKDGYVGFMKRDTLGTSTNPNARVSALATFIYPTANMKLPPRARLTLGSYVEIVSEDGDFVEIAGGGFVYKAHLLGRHDVITWARMMLGVPYLWGGSSSDGIDCSGFVQLVYSMIGNALPRDSDQQEQALAEITREDVRAGDLVFFKGHVALMTSTDDIIHANGHHMAVKEEPLAAAEARVQQNAGGKVTSFRRVF